MVSAADKEQIAMLSQLWKDYGRGILLAITVGLLIGLGWKYWYQHKNNVRVQSAVAYQQFYSASMIKNDKLAASYLNNLQQNFKTSPYTTMASMLSARIHVENGDSKPALTDLNWVISNSKTPSFREIARVRAAQILLELKQYSEADAILNTVDDKSFQPMIDHIKGDIYTAQGEKEKATKAYEAAKVGYEGIGIENPVLNMQSAS